MSQATSPRNQEIKAIHIQYQDFYRIGGGLVVILVLIFVGSWIFGQNQLGLKDTLLGYVTNVATEGLSVIATIIVIDQLNRRRDREERKLALFRQAKSRSNDVAVEALEQIQYEGWWDELLEHYRSTVNYQVNLSQVQWAGGVILMQANLEGADLTFANLQEAFLLEANLQGVDLSYANLQGAKSRSANLQGANLMEANLQGANLMEANLQRAILTSANLQRVHLTFANLQGVHLTFANLQGVHLTFANLQGAYLAGANLQGVDLMQANLEGADLDNANLQAAILMGVNLQEANLVGVKFDEKTVLPDATFIRKDEDGNYVYDKYWSPDTDMSRYTNPDHPDFWQSPTRYSQGNR